MSDAIVAQDLVRKFGDLTVVDKVSFQVKHGEVFGFLGPNGSGKTTVIKMLTGILPLTGGKGVVDGIDVSENPDEVKRRIGYMSQKFSLYDDLTVLENLRFYAQVYGLRGAEINRKIEETMARNAIEPYKDRLAGKLSGGWKQRLALGCAMLHNPKILYLDEPTAGIDPVARRKLWDLLFDLSGQGITFFVTTHYMDEAERCSHLAYIYYGKLIADGTPDTLREIPEVRPPGTHRFEISTKDVTTALRKARKLPFMRSATIFGRSIHALIDDKITEQELTRELDNIGVHPDEIRPLAPDLEDVFVELTYRHQAEREAASGQSV
ncbi:MAG: ABC transporter ATP-binding protein [Terriglobales bacterium]|jgi:ABC-2 type transport system ATP-binding protein